VTGEFAIASRVALDSAASIDIHLRMNFNACAIR
jgi:hypothetical protein